MELNIVLKKLRESRGLTIIQLAEKAGIGKGTIGDIETGRSKASFKTLKKIAVSLKLNDDEQKLLFSTFIPKDIKLSPEFFGLDSRGKKELSALLEEVTLMFDDENIPLEDKEKMMLAIQEAFYDAKLKNKRKK